ncbi:MAG: glycine cleavage system protein GcvH [Acidimicrobiia bacterium]|nr:glycine cleavage system protein GcvH [Acidimicrobiia bacterium]MYC58536.1 glycine cleavage system protein GcvH [Acidimicrobiia bacterium]MYG94294.1 glycine cleavage system protein GcvH [Acidimicrobiia bacterium]MYI30357.1 glycine cleavage system protein GcvH [Acidimicrobiia bacterium]
MQTFNVPSQLRYSEDHEWTKIEGNRVYLGITDYAQDALGDVVYIDLPEVGTAVHKGEAFSEVESTKSVSEIYAPVSGVIAQINSDLVDHPERLNEDPYGEGWICVIETTDLSEVDQLMDGAAYSQLTESVE